MTSSVSGHHGGHAEDGGERGPEPDAEVARDEQRDQPDERDDEHSHGDRRAQGAQRREGAAERHVEEHGDVAGGQQHVDRRHREPAEPVPPARHAADVLGRRVPERFEALVGVGGHAPGPVRQERRQLAHAQADDQPDHHDQRDGRDGRRAHGRDGERDDAGHQDRAGQADHERAPPVGPPAQGGGHLGGSAAHHGAFFTHVLISSVGSGVSVRCGRWIACHAAWCRSEGLEVAVELPGRDLGVGGPDLGALGGDEVVDVVALGGLAQARRAAPRRASRWSRACHSVMGMARSPSSAASSSVSASRLSSQGSPGSSLRSMPSRPAAMSALSARYGLAEPSMQRSSTRPGSGTRSMWVRSLPP